MRKMIPKRGTYKEFIENRYNVYKNELVWITDLAFLGIYDGEDLINVMKVLEVSSLPLIGSSGLIYKCGDVCYLWDTKNERFVKPNINGMELTLEV